MPVLETSYLLTSLLFSSIGLGYFIYGKKQKHKIVYYTGIGLMLFPYAVSDPTFMFFTGATLMATPKILQRMDMGD